MRAIVLSGGGSTGAYQAGVIRALDELGMKFDIVVGTSIGSINGAMYVTGDADKAYEMWKTISFESIFSEKIKYESQKDELDVILKLREKYDGKNFFDDTRELIKSEVEDLLINGIKYNKK